MKTYIEKSIKIPKDIKLRCPECRYIFTYTIIIRDRGLIRLFCRKCWDLYILDYSNLSS